MIKEVTINNNNNIDDKGMKSTFRVHPVRLSWLLWFYPLSCANFESIILIKIQSQHMTAALKYQLLPNQTCFY